ncbi:hypothetical protein Ahu01nite_086390 [Winogradskya humida]|uniref:Uncharacterized protein n=1 Tax=Winogradskya humida TaxID=113566 RepID=A0ABQ4A5B2_9ACTN|nr:hypothetical protein Ahu01nite_086390 [Actinoplanes humidus]
MTQRVRDEDRDQPHTQPEPAERAQAVFTPPGPPDLSRLERTFATLAEDVAISFGPELLTRLQADAPPPEIRVEPLFTDCTVKWRWPSRRTPPRSWSAPAPTS